MSSAETAPFGAVFVCRGASCSRRGRVSAAFSVRRVFILRPRFSVLDDELGRVGLPLSASISGPGRTWPRPVGRGSCCAARGIYSRPVIRGAWFVSCCASAFERGPWASMRLPRYWVELADPGLEFGQVLARARRSVGRELLVELADPGPWRVVRGPGSGRRVCHFARRVCHFFPAARGPKNAHLSRDNG